MIGQTLNGIGRKRNPERLTPDITIKGRMPTKAEYAAHLELLRDIAAGRSTWLSKGDMTDLQHLVWVAVHQQGLVDQEGSRGDGRHRLTPYGKLYLRQRDDPKKNPRGRRRRRKNDFSPAMSPAVARRQRKQLGRDIAAHHKAANLDKLRALRRAITEARQSSKRLRKEAVSLCQIGRKMARERAKQIRIEGRQKIREDIIDDRAAARAACDGRKATIRENVKSAVARARAELKEEKRYQREIRGIDQRQRKERPKSTAAERRGESDDQVRDNIPPDLVPLFERVKRQIKGSDRETRTESFLRYAEENPGEVAAAIGREAEKEIARLQREEAKESRALRRRGVSAAELAAVPF